ncbi:MAG: AraC family transcriptional regulator [Bacteroidales bacterium]|nr:AraC family transcriptional regulator [Bacteroidales bacterium]
MKKTVSTLKLKEAEVTQTLENKGIDNDVILVNDYHCPFGEGDPFKPDATSAILYEKGWVDVNINMQHFHVEAPALLVFLEDAIIEYGAQSDDLRAEVVVMSGQFTRSLFQNDNSLAQALFVSFYHKPLIQLKEEELFIFNRYYQMLEDIIDYRDNPYRIETARHLTLAMFYGFTYRNYPVQELQRSSRQDEIVTRFMDLLRLHHKREHELQFYADALFISIKHLSNTVKAATGKTAAKWIEDYVITESKALLRSTAMSVSQISDEMGFADQSLFGKYFKRVTGISPKEYRK